MFVDLKSCSRLKTYFIELSSNNKTEKYLFTDFFLIKNCVQNMYVCMNVYGWKLWCFLEPHQAKNDIRKYQRKTLIDVS